MTAELLKTRQCTTVCPTLRQPVIRTQPRLTVLRNFLAHAVINPKVLFVFLGMSAIYTTAVVTFIDGFPKYHLAETKEVLSLSTIAIALVFGFRINTAYDRWWEGRKLWGQLVNEIRNLSIKHSVYFETSEEERHQFARLLIAFAYSLKFHLRDTLFAIEELGLNPAPHNIRHLPMYIATAIYASVGGGRLNDPLSRLFIDGHVKALMDICGACERIKNSPVSSWFKAGIWIWLTMYFLLLPWLVASNLNYWTVPLMAFATYFGLSLELLAEEIQEPFGRKPNDLPTDKLCKTIKMSVEQSFGVQIATADDD